MNKALEEREIRLYGIGIKMLKEVDRDEDLALVISPDWFCLLDLLTASIRPTKPVIRTAIEQANQGLEALMVYSYWRELDWVREAAEFIKRLYTDPWYVDAWLKGGHEKAYRYEQASK